MGTEQDSSQQGANRRFVIMGLPRSGTTYLMTLLNAHRDIYCSGEQFNPHAIVGDKRRNERLGAITQRDREAVRFMNRFFARHEDKGYARVGFKFMIGHNIRVLRRLEKDTSISLIYVHRKNKLAQVSSLIKAAQSQKWAQHRADAHVSRKIQAGPRQISHRWHEYATFDHLFEPWFEARPHHKIALEYRELFAPGFERRISDFLGVAPDPGMKSPLVKQGSNRILDRFEDPDKIEKYFRELGLEAWLETEI